MCVMSMVIDDFGDRFGRRWPWIQPTEIRPFVPTATSAEPNPFVMPQLPFGELAELRKLIAEFKEAIAAAKTVDRLTKQPDCEDPEKAKLIERVDELEKRLAKLEKPKGTRKSSQKRAQP